MSAVYRHIPRLAVRRDHATTLDITTHFSDYRAFWSQMIWTAALIWGHS